MVASIRISGIQIVQTYVNHTFLKNLSFPISAVINHPSVRLNKHPYMVIQNCLEVLIRCHWFSFKFTNKGGSRL